MIIVNNYKESSFLLNKISISYECRYKNYLIQIGYYFLKLLSLKGVFFICKTNLSVFGVPNINI